MKNIKSNILLALSFAFEGCSHNQIVFKPIDINASEPSIINVLFSAENEDGRPITDLNLNDLAIYEDGEILNDRNSTFQKLLKGDAIEQVSRQIIAITFVPSKDHNWEEFQKSLTNLLKNIDVDEKHPVMILSIGEDIKIVADFITDRDELLKSVSLYPKDLGKTINLNEGIYKLQTLLNSGNKFDVRSLLVITNKKDQAKKIANDDLNKLLLKNSIFTIGIGEETDDSLLKDIGGAGYLELDSIEELDENIINITEFFNRTGKNIYLFQYASPKRRAITGNSNHVLTLSTLEEGEIANNRLEAMFNSSEFKSVKPTIVLTQTGRTSENSELILKAETLWTDKIGQYEWIVGDPLILIPSIKSDDSSEAIFHFGKKTVGKTAIVVRDIINETEISYPIALGVYHKPKWDFQDGKIPTDFKISGEKWEIWKDKSNISLKSPKLNDNESASISIQGYFEGSKISFNYKIESEDGCDELIFLIDGKSYKDSGY